MHSHIRFLILVVEISQSFDINISRYVRLKIISTFLMRSPIITTFGVFGATFECVDKVVYMADRYLIPLFVTSVAVILLLLLLSAAAVEQKKRWKVLI